MRLTLRTLLAWLDDTLTPAEVRAIGKQVSESDFAKDLVERIHKVTRQRRLTVPPRTGADSVDPNLVSAYLDNELDAESVAEFEKKCLTSDVHLAEVASVHQVLSLIGQKAKVPTEARERMYQLIKGRESTRPAKPPRRPKKVVVERVVVAEPIQAWVKPNAPRRKLSQQFEPILAVLGLIGVLCWSAWVSLSPSNTVARRSERGVVEPGKGKVVEPQAIVAKVEEPKDAPKVADATEKGIAAKAAEKPEAPIVTEAAAKTFPDGTIGEVEKPDGLLLRYSAEKREWERLVEKTPCREGERILSLEPFRAIVDTPRTSCVLIGETEIVGRETPSNLAARMELALGKIVIKGTTPPLPVEVVANGATITVQPEAGQTIGVERVVQRVGANTEVSAPLTRFWVAEGTVKLVAADGVTTLQGPGSITLESPNKWSEKSADPVPAWLTQTAIEPDKQKDAEAFLALFRPERPLVSSLVEASEDENPAIAQLAISALRAAGDVSYIVPILNRSGTKSSTIARRAAIASLREAMSQGPESAKAVRAQLVADLGEDIAEATEGLLVGYPSSGPAQLENWSKLVKVLGTTDDADVGLRELALDNLSRISGLGDLGYNAEKPEGDGLKAWRRAESEKRAKVLNATDPTPKKAAK